MECLVCGELLSDFSSATVDYFIAVSNLAKVADAHGDDGSFSDAFKKAGQEHEKCEHARYNVRQHLSGHYVAMRGGGRLERPRRRDKG